MSSRSEAPYLICVDAQEVFDLVRFEVAQVGRKFFDGDDMTVV